jgi:hypothetical protein
MSCHHLVSILAGTRQTTTAPVRDSSQDPRQVARTVEQTLPGDLSMEDWQAMKEVIAAVRQAIPDAAQRPAREVLQHVLVALRQAEAKTIEQTYAENPSADESKR